MPICLRGHLKRKDKVREPPCVMGQGTTLLDCRQRRSPNLSIQFVSVPQSLEVVRGFLLALPVKEARYTCGDPHVARMLMTQSTPLSPVRVYTCDLTRDDMWAVQALFPKPANPVVISLLLCMRRFESEDLGRHDTDTRRNPIITSTTQP